MLKHAEDDADISTDDPNVLTVSTYRSSDPEDAATAVLVATGRRRRQVQHRRKIPAFSPSRRRPTTRCLRTPAWTTSTT